MRANDFDSRTGDADPRKKRDAGIKGIGLITVAGFIAEVGDINRFDHPKQIQKLAGLNLKKIALANIRENQHK